MKRIPATVIILLLTTLCTGCRPSETGLTPSGLPPCPDRPNCVTTQGGTGEQVLQPLTYRSDRLTAYTKIKQIISQLENAAIVEENPAYLHAEFKSRYMGFVDDVEFWFPGDASVIHMRSASRLGYSDFGVNRKRMEHIRTLFMTKSPEVAPGRNE